MSELKRGILRSVQGIKALSYVTKGFYDRSYVGLWLFEVIGREYDEMARWVEELRDQAVPQRATWSLPYWEAAYGIEVNEALPDEIRRQRLLSKIMERVPMNPARMEAILSRYTGNPAHVTENAAPGTFAVEFTEGLFQSTETVIALIQKLKPAYLMFSLKITHKLPARAKFRAVTAVGGIEELPPPCDRRLTN